MNDELINQYVEQHYRASVNRRVNERVQNELDALFLGSWGKLTREEQDEGMRRLHALQAQR